MKELKKAIDLAFEEGEVSEEELTGLMRYVYNEIHIHVLEMKRDQATKEIAMIEKFRSQIKHLMELAG